MARYVGDRDSRVVCGIVFENPTPSGLLAFFGQQCALGDLGVLQRRASAGGFANWPGRDEHPRRHEKRSRGGSKTRTATYAMTDAASESAVGVFLKFLLLIGGR